MPNPRLEEFRPGKALGDGLSMVGRHLPAFATISSLLHAPLVLISLLWVSTLDFSSPAAIERSLSGMWIWLIAIVLLGVILGFVSQGALVYCVVQDLRGAPVRVGDALRVAMSRAPQILAAGLLTGVIITLGLVACIVPGLIFASRLAFAVPVAVLERSGASRALSRSGDLTDGLRWKVFAILLVLGLTERGLSKLYEIVMETEHPTPTTIGVVALGGIVISAVVAMWNAASVGVAYYEARRLKEGVEIDQLARVFD